MMLALLSAHHFIGGGEKKQTCLCMNKMNKWWGPNDG